MILGLVIGTVNSYVLDVDFMLNGRVNHFYPESIAKRFDFFPAVTVSLQEHKPT
jgi:hypothetical protein